MVHGLEKPLKPYPSFSPFSRTRSACVYPHHPALLCLHREKFFTVSVVKHWKRLPREVVDDTSMEVFKARLDGAVSNLV